MNPDNKTVRHLEPAKTLGERIRRMRFTLARRASQLVVLGLFFGTARWGWEIGGKPILSGDLSASRILETLPLADPLALLERLAAGVMPSAAALTGAAIVLALYGALGARIFCGWVCPMNIVVDAAQWLRRKLGLSADLVRLSRKTRYVVLAGVLLASATTGSAAFEFLSPQAMLWRDLVWGTGLSALTSALAVFAIELVLMRDGWCSDRIYGAERGTAYHRVFELMDIENKEYSKDIITNMIQAQIDSKLLTKIQGEAVNPYDILKFTKTKVFERMAKAKESNQLYRERQFLLGVQAKEIKEHSNSDELMIIQGIIDVCFIEDDRYVILDYKTDNVDSMDELKHRYKKQLECYKLALEKITGKKVSEMIIYSVKLGEEMAI